MKWLSLPLRVWNPFKSSPMAKKLVYHNRFGYHLIMGEAHGIPDGIVYFDRGAETVAFELVKETERAYIYREISDIPIVSPPLDEPSPEAVLVTE